MSDDQTQHRIADELQPGWLGQWAAGGIADIESYLAKHAEFQGFIDTGAQ